MSDEKSAKTFGAEDNRPFSDRTVRRLRRIGEDWEGSKPDKAFSRSEEERVGFSVREQC
jgi:hypothetical protein